MPSRVVRGEINRSESLSNVSPNAELTFRALITEVDDYGRFDARPKALKAALFPLRDEFTAARIFVWVMELHAEGCVRLYTGTDGRSYLQLTGWEKHRGTSKRGQSSKYPEMLAPGDSPDIRGNPGDPSESRESRVGSRESGIENREYESPTAEPVVERTRKRPRKSLAPDDLDTEQKVALRAWVRAKHPAQEPHLRELVDACLDYHRARGTPMTDWVAACRTWIRRDRTIGNSRSSPATRQDDRAQLLMENLHAATRLAAERQGHDRGSAGTRLVAGANVRQLRAGSEPVAD